MLKVLFCTTALVGIAVSSPAFAQAAGADDPEASDSIGDIVVTAQRREESVQRTALSIEVFKGDDLAERGIGQPDDLTKLAVGVQVGGGSASQIYVRGVGDFGVIATANPAVVTSLDGVAIARPQAIAGNFFDLDRVEILKGPQGTLYGRNANGGAVNLLTARPRLGQLSGYLNASYGNYDAWGTEGALNVPMGDSFAVRLSGQFSDRDGYLSDGTEDDRHESVRLQGLYEAGPLNLRLLGSYTHLGGKGSGLAVIPQIPGQSAWVGSASKVASDYYLAIAQANFVASGGASPPPVVFDRPDASLLFQDIESWSASGQLEYDFGGATLTVIPAYRNTHSRYSLQPHFNYAPGGQGTDGDRSDQYSLETRLSNSGDKFKWVFGAFVFSEDQSTDFAVNTGLLQRFHIKSDLSTRSYAFFGEGTYSLTDSFRLTGGIRYTSDKRTLTNLEKHAVSPTITGNPGPLALPCVPAAGFQVGTECNLLPPLPFDSARTFNQVTWRAGIEFDVAPQSMLFANVATGFKAGGFNQAIDPTNVSKVLPFSPEKLTAYTVGLRNRFLDNKVQFNVEGFYWDYKDLQLTRLILDGSGNLALTTQNAGKARVYGFNADVIVKPAAGTTLHAGIEYLDSKYSDFSFAQAAFVTPPGSSGCAVTPSNLPPSPIGPFVNVNCSGLPLVRAPNWSGNVGFTQVMTLGQGNVVFDTDLAFASSRFTSTAFVPNSKVDGYANWSASLTYNAPDDRWFVSGFVRNITNAKIYTGGGGDQSPFVTGFVTSSIGAPRTYGVRVGAKF